MAKIQLQDFGGASPQQAIQTQDINYDPVARGLMAMGNALEEQDNNKNELMAKNELLLREEAKANIDADLQYKVQNNEIASEHIKEYRDASVAEFDKSRQQVRAQIRPDVMETYLKPKFKESDINDIPKVVGTYLQKQHDEYVGQFATNLSYIDKQLAVDNNIDNALASINDLRKDAYTLWGEGADAKIQDVTDKVFSTHVDRLSLQGEDYLLRGDIESAKKFLTAMEEDSHRIGLLGGDAKANYINKSHNLAKSIMSVEEAAPKVKKAQVNESISQLIKVNNAGYGFNSSPDNIKRLQFAMSNLSPADEDYHILENAAQFQQQADSLGLKTAEQYQQWYDQTVAEYEKTSGTDPWAGEVIKNLDNFKTARINQAKLDTPLTAKQGEHYVPLIGDWDDSKIDNLKKRVNEKVMFDTSSQYKATLLTTEEVASWRTQFNNASDRNSVQQMINYFSEGLSAAGTPNSEKMLSSIITQITALPAQPKVGDKRVEQPVEIPSANPTVSNVVSAELDKTVPEEIKAQTTHYALKGKDAKIFNYQASAGVNKDKAVQTDRKAIESIISSNIQQTLGSKTFGLMQIDSDTLSNYANTAASAIAGKYENAPITDEIIQNELSGELGKYLFGNIQTISDDGVKVVYPANVDPDEGRDLLVNSFLTQYAGWKKKGLKPTDAPLTDRDIERAFDEDGLLVPVLNTAQNGYLMVSRTTGKPVYGYDGKPLTLHLTGQ